MTRNQFKNKVAVDYLSMHLRDIIEKHPLFSVEAKAQMVLRRFLSKMKGHALSEIDRQLNSVRNVSTDFVAVLRSFLYFILQKIK